MSSASGMLTPEAASTMLTLGPAVHNCNVCGKRHQFNAYHISGSSHPTLFRCMNKLVGKRHRNSDLNTFHSCIKLLEQTTKLLERLLRTYDILYSQAGSLYEAGWEICRALYKCTSVHYCAGRSSAIYPAWLLMVPSHEANRIIEFVNMLYPLASKNRWGSIESAASHLLSLCKSYEFPNDWSQEFRDHFALLIGVVEASYARTQAVRESLLEKMKQTGDYEFVARTHGCF